MTTPSLRRLSCVAALAALSLLQGCQSMYLHNPERAALASTAKKQIDSVDVDALGKMEAENIGRLTDEEIKTVHHREKLVAQLAVVEMSASGASIQAHYEATRMRMRSALGTDSMLKLKEAADCQADRPSAIDNIGVLQEKLRLLGMDKPPACSASMAQTVVVPNGLPAAYHAQFTDAYDKLKAQCALITAAACSLMDPDGEVAKSEAEDKRRRDQAVETKKALQQAKTTYDAAVARNKAATDKAEKKEEDLRADAQRILDNIDRLSKVAPAEAERIKASALVDLLTAAASGTVPEAEASASLEIARSVPALAESVAKARAARVQVPVSHLLLALNNQVILAERDDRLAALDAEELAALKRKRDARGQQAALYRRYSDSLCKLVITASGKEAPGGACDTIAFGKDPKDKLRCTLSIAGQDKPWAVDDCVLAQSWRALFASTPGKPEGRRYLHEAAAAFLQARLNAYQTTEEEFRRIDVGQRRSVVRREASLAQWKNVVSVPAGQLEGYYAGGTTPAEVADLLVKALGFTAIAIGVSK